ncbi:MAG: hypothetical protein Alpg2KO_00040 [Alphaproteobacteria bacterium]
MHQVTPASVRITPLKGREREVTVLAVTGPGVLPALGVQHGSRKTTILVSEIKSAIEVDSGHKFESPEQLFMIMQQRATDTVMSDADATNKDVQEEPPAKRWGCFRFFGMIAAGLVTFLLIAAALMPNPLSDLSDSDQATYRALTSELESFSAPLSSQQLERRLTILRELKILDDMALPQRSAGRKAAIARDLQLLEQTRDSEARAAQEAKEAQERLMQTQAAERQRAEAQEAVNRAQQEAEAKARAETIAGLQTRLDALPVDPSTTDRVILIEQRRILSELAELDEAYEPPLQAAILRLQELDKLEEDARCEKNAICLGKRIRSRIIHSCKKSVEAHAKYQMEWQDGMLSPAFSPYKFGDEPGTLIFIGDKARFQNGFGAWQMVEAYICVVDIETRQALRSEVSLRE